MSLLTPEPLEISSLSKQALLELQVLLKLAGYPLVTDGLYGNETKRTFEQFKKDYNLTRPTEVGKTTLEFLVEVILREILSLEETPQKQTKERTVVDFSLIKKYEGLRLNAYRCPAGVWTIGYGCTYHLDGRKVKPGDRLASEAEAEELLVHVFERDFLPQLRKIPFWNEMNRNQRTALASFAWNLGAHFYGNRGFNTISSALRSKRWEDVPAALMLYVNPGSSFEVGLRRRRKEEGRIWSS